MLLTPVANSALLVVTVLFGGCTYSGERVGPMTHQAYGQLNPNAPEELAEFAFLIGSWRCDIRVRARDGSFETHHATWTARYILDGYVIADVYREVTLDGQLVRLGATYRSYNSQDNTWVMKWHDALTSTWIDLGPAELGGVEASGTTITFKHYVPPDGLFRCTFSNIARDRFTWLGDFSNDGGRTWDEAMVIQASRTEE